MPDYLDRLMADHPPRPYRVALADIDGYLVDNPVPTDDDERTEWADTIAYHHALAVTTMTWTCYALVYSVEFDQQCEAEESDAGTWGYLHSRDLTVADLADETLTQHVERIAFAIVYEATLATLADLPAGHVAVDG